MKSISKHINASFMKIHRNKKIYFTGFTVLLILSSSLQLQAIIIIKLYIPVNKSQERTLQGAFKLPLASLVLRLSKILSVILLLLNEVSCKDNLKLQHCSWALKTRAITCGLCTLGSVTDYPFEINMGHIG